jgi:6-methylsalicylic acid synthase
VAGTDIQVWRTSLDDATRPYPGSHAIEGVEIVPAAALATTFFGACGGQAITELALSAPLLTADRRDLQVVRDGTALRLAARLAGHPDAAWQMIATATVPTAREGPPSRPAPASPAASTDLELRPMPTGEVTRRLAAVGVAGTGFDWTVEELRLGAGALRARVRCGSMWAPLLDAAMSVAPSAFPGDPLLRMVTHVDQVVTIGEPPESVEIDAWLDPGSIDTVVVLITDLAGSVVGWLSGLRYPVIDMATPTSGHGVPGGGPPENSLGNLGFDELRALLIAEVGALIAAEMRLDPTELSPDRPLVEQGLDSVLTVVVRRRLEKRFRCPLPTTLLWRRPTIVAISDHIAALVSPNGAGGTNAG